MPDPSLTPTAELLAWIESALPLIADQGWHLEGAALRNDRGFCPLCAAAEAYAGTRYATAPAFALKAAFGPVEAARLRTGMSVIVLAADLEWQWLNPVMEETRRQLLSLFNVQETLC